MKYSASPYRYFMKQAIFLLVSFLCSILVIQFHSRVYRHLSRFFLLLVVGALGVLLVYGSVKNKAISWVDLGFFSIQPSEFAKIITIVYLATYYEKHKEHLDNLVVALSPLVLPGVIAGLIFAQPDLGTTIIYIGIVAFIFFIAPISKENSK